MRSYLCVFFLEILVLALWMPLLCGCEGRPVRKKLPDLTTLQGWEDMPSAKTGTRLFFTGDTTIVEGGSLKSFLSVAMPDPVYDSLVISLARSYEPFAATLIAQWAKQGNKGILIDLRAKGNEDSRADFLLTRNLPDNTKIMMPLVLIWDRQSAHRSAYLIKAMNSMPEIRCDLLSNSHETDGKGRNDCFSPTTASFDGQ